MKYILTRTGLFPSANLLRVHLQEATGQKIFILKEYRDRDKDKLILSYGNSSFPDKIPAVNTPEFIKTVSHKLKFSKLLNQHGINAVEFRRGTPSREDYPVYVRKNLQAMKGVGIIYCRDEEEFNKNNGSSYYWSRGKRIKDEYRIHVGVTEESVKLMKVFKKVPLDPNCVVRNNETCHYSLRHIEDRYERLRNYLNGLKKVSIFVPGSFFTLDVALLVEGGYLTFEGNTASGINEESAKMYTKFLEPYLNM